MKFLIIKTCQGVFDTEIERQRIRVAFRRDKETRRSLLTLMDAIEAGQWKKAYRMLESKWWQGYDKKVHCPRLELVGGIALEVPGIPGQMSEVLPNWSGYDQLVYAMFHAQENGINKYTVEKVQEQD